jgi:hypothetical protein
MVRARVTERNPLASVRRETISSCRLSIEHGLE